MVRVDDGGRICEIPLRIHVCKTDNVFVVVILHRVSMLAHGAAQHDMSQLVSACLHLAAPEGKVVGVLCGVNRI